jgi:hypothetical protein
LGEKRTGYGRVAQGKKVNGLLFLGGFGFVFVENVAVCKKMEFFVGHF